MSDEELVIKPEVELPPDFPVGFFTEMHPVMKDKLLKQFMDLMWVEPILVNPLDQNMPERIAKAFKDLHDEANICVNRSQERIDMIEGKAEKMNRKEKRKNEKRLESVRERARKAGLVSLMPNVPGPKGKLIL